MDKKKGVILLAVVLINVIATILIYPYFYPADIKELDIYLKVSNYTGFNVDTSAVFFGAVARDGKASRDIIVANEDAKSHSVNIKIEGILKDWIIVSDNKFNLNPLQNKTVKLIVNVPSDAGYGNYTGKVRIIFKQ